MCQSICVRVNEWKCQCNIKTAQYAQGADEMLISSTWEFFEKLGKEGRFEWIECETQECVLCNVEERVCVWKSVFVHI